MERLANPSVRRVFVIDPESEVVEGIISLSDVATYQTTKHPLIRDAEVCCTVKRTYMTLFYTVSWLVPLSHAAHD